MALQVDIDAGVAVVTIDHPPTNLVDGPFVGALRSAIAELESDDNVRVAVFRSHDPDFFLMHGDVEMLSEVTPPYVPATEPNIAAATFAGLQQGRLVTIGLRDVAADELLALGWLDRLIPAAEIESTVLAVARRIASMPPDAVAAVKHIVDGPADQALVAESDALARFLAAGSHSSRMKRFLAAGGQTREAETTRMQSILEAALGTSAD